MLITELTLLLVSHKLTIGETRMGRPSRMFAEIVAATLPAAKNAPTVVVVPGAVPMA
ncbi:hypothetical protein D3C86_2194100 [compost metagenome]